MLEHDAKNYHAWAYRQWVVQTHSLWEGELEFTEQLMCEVRLLKLPHQLYCQQCRMTLARDLGLCGGAAS